MKFRIFGSGCLLLTALALGCQETTTTGPRTPASSGTRTTTTPTTPTTPTTTDTGTTSSTTATVKKLSLMAMKSQTLKQGDTDKVMVTINRDHFDDAVTVGIENLPKGISLVDGNHSIASGDNTTTLTLRAAPDAQLGDHSVTLFAQAPGIDRNTQMFTLTVKEK